MPQLVLVSTLGGAFSSLRPMSFVRPIGTYLGRFPQTALALEANPVLFAHLHEVPSSKPHQMKCLSAHSWLFISFHNSFRPRKSRVRTTSSVNPSDFAISRFVYPIAKRRSGSRYIGFIWPISSVRRSMLSVLTAASSGTGAASGSFGTSSSNSSRCLRSISYARLLLQLTR